LQRHLESWAQQVAVVACDASEPAALSLSGVNHVVHLRGWGGAVDQAFNAPVALLQNVQAMAQEAQPPRLWFITQGGALVADAPWPGFTPDLLSIVLVTAIQAKGSLLIHQKMFESRLFFVDKLIDMGAQIILCDPHRATVIGLARQTRLRGITMSSPDIRAGVALLIAALSAEGTSRISNIEQIDRGYQHIDTRLTALGAHLTRVAD
jgi:UDP-N-acetylglucosamine enolpyruvyl transferase